MAAVPTTTGKKRGPKKGKKQKPQKSSTTGRKRPRIQMANWRRKVQKGRIKFDDEAKEIYLKELAHHGMKGTAAAAAGVTPNTVNGHYDVDPDFAEQYNIAEQAYRDRVVKHATHLALDGVEIKKYNKNGDIIEERVEYPVRLIELEMKRVEPAYREKQTIDLNTTGGVMIAPPGMTTEDWIKSQEEKNVDKPQPGTAEKE